MNQMNKEKFSEWLRNNQVPSKMVNDSCSRVKRLEQVFTIIYGNKFSFEEEFNKDRFKNLFFMLRKKGVNPELAKYKNLNLPIGKISMGSIRLSLKKYSLFLAENIKNNK